MSQKHKRILNSILQQPVSGNLHWKDVESMLVHLGASIEPGHGARMRIVLNDVQGSLHRPHHSGVCNKHDIRHLRDYLIQAGLDEHALAS